MRPGDLLKMVINIGIFIAIIIFFRFIGIKGFIGFFAGMLIQTIMFVLKPQFLEAFLNFMGYDIQIKVINYGNIR